MGKVTVKFNFDIHDAVKLVDINIDGYIDSLIKDVNGLQYRVVYWNDGTRKSTWVYEREIKPR